VFIFFWSNADDPPNKPTQKKSSLKIRSWNSAY